MINEKLAELVARKKAGRIARDAMLSKVQSKAFKRKRQKFKVRAGAAANAKAVEDS